MTQVEYSIYAGYRGLNSLFFTAILITIQKYKISGKILTKFQQTKAKL